MTATFNNINNLGWTGQAANPSAGGGAGAMSNLGVGMAIMGMIQSGIGTFYAAKSNKNQLKSQAMTFDYQKQMSALNARAMEDTAQQIMRAGEQDIGRLTLRAGQVKASSKVAQAKARTCNGLSLSQNCYGK